MTSVPPGATADVTAPMTAPMTAQALADEASALRRSDRARSRDLAEAELGNARAQLRASVIAAYFATLVAQERAQLASDSAALATRGADAVRAERTLAVPGAAQRSIVFEKVPR